MRKVLFSVVLFAFNMAIGADPIQSVSKCQLDWHLLSEGPIKKSVTVKGKAVVKITDRIEATLIIKGVESTLTVRELYKDNKNFSLYQFSCDQYLNCKGFRKQEYNGQVEEQNLSIDPSGYFGIGKIGAREVFSYLPTKNGFQYHYIVYRTAKGEPMGLEVLCHE